MRSSNGYLLQMAASSVEFSPNFSSLVGEGFSPNFSSSVGEGLLNDIKLWRSGEEFPLTDLRHNYVDRLPGVVEAANV